MGHARPCHDAHSAARMRSHMMSDERPSKPENERADGGDVAPPQSAQPNMDEWIARYGGRAHIPWTEWDRAVEEWKAARRAEFERKKMVGRMLSTALQQTLS